MQKLLTTVGLAFLTTSQSQASEFEPAMQAYLQTNIAGWAQSQVIVDAILSQNAMTSGYDGAQILALDEAWQSEVGMGSTPTITPVIENIAADFLREQVASSDGVITEVFIMDSVGLNVAASDVTSDMWQGDEDKFLATFPIGPNAIHFSEIEFDESTQTYQGQISLTIIHPETGEPIGAMTVGLNAEALF